MKKLMIAAAAAAMIAGAYADIGGADITGTGYNVNVTLKTTVSTAKKVTVQYYLGALDKDSTKMWYEDGSVTNAIATDLANTTSGFVHKFTTKKISGKSVPCLTAAGKKDAATLALVIPLAGTDKTGRTHNGAYDYKSGNVWCETFSDADEYCYRTAGTVKMAGYYVIDDCCLTTLIASSQSGTAFLHAFGAPLYANSKKSEIFVDDVIGAGIYVVDKDGNAVVPVDNKKKDRAINYLAVAGQGSYGTVKVNDGSGVLTDADGLVAISGYAVGYCDQVDCTSCCVPGTVPELVWDCGGADAANTATAAFGTFTIKYNAAITK